MLEIRQLTPSDARRVPWKNGRGVTDELALWPPGASFERGDFDWRIACAGVDATWAELLAGPVTDVNVLARRGRAAARLSELCGAGSEPLGAGHVFLHLVEGAVDVRVAGGAPTALAARESLWIRGGQPSDALEVAGRCTALLVRIDDLSA